MECNHKCLNECFKCQELSTPQDESKDVNKIASIEQTKHVNCKERYDGLLFCGNICNSPMKPIPSHLHTNSIANFAKFNFEINYASF